MRRFLTTIVLTLALYCCVAFISPSAARAQYVSPPIVTYYQPAPTYYVPAYVPPARYSFYAAPTTVYYQPAPVVSYYPSNVSVVGYAPPVSPGYAVTNYYVRPGIFRDRVYSTTSFYAPAVSYSPSYYSPSYYSPSYYSPSYYSPSYYSPSYYYYSTPAYYSYYYTPAFYRY